MATPTAFKIGRGFQFNDGSSLAVSPTSQARMRYNASLNRFEQSLDGGAFTALQSGASLLTSSYAAGGSSADSRLLLDSTRAGLWVKDNATPIGVILFAVTDSAETAFYLSVRATRTLVQNSAQTGTAQTAFRVAPGAHTATTASTEIVDIDFQTNRTIQFSTGALATNRTSIFRAPTLSFVGASTVTNAATLAIDAAPVAGTNATITNSYALWVQAGATRLGGQLTVEGSIRSSTNKTLDVGASGNAFRLLIGTNVPNRTAVADVDHNVSVGDGTVAYTSLSAPRTVTLPGAGVLVAGSRIIVVNETANTSTITISSSLTIRGATTITTAYGSRHYHYTGAEYIELP